MGEPKVTAEQLQEAAARFLAGELLTPLAKEYGVTTTALRKRFIKEGVRLPPADYRRPTQSRDLEEFTSRARSVLWRQDAGQKKTYERWQARVEELASPDGGGLTKQQAIVRASKEFDCLTRLFREYSVGKYDPNPESHPNVVHFGQKPQAAPVTENREQSYRDNLRWAIEAAGAYLRTGRAPEMCPNDAAFYLYQQAISEPKDFLGRVGQIESKGDVESEERRNARLSGRRSIEEINSMLESLEDPGEESDGA